MPKHFTRIRDLGFEGAWKVLERAKEMKDTGYRGRTLEGKVATLIFEKASTRTRISFEVAVRHLGGTTIFMTPAESQLGRSEPLRDTARVISRYTDCMIVRTFGQAKIDELASFGSIPVVNALTDEGHPCQVMSDVLTMYERTPDLSQVRVAWIGDGNNMANSWIEAAMYFPFELFMAFPEGYEPDRQLLGLALEAGAKIFLTRDPHMAIDGAHYVNTDVWASMGQEEEQKRREAEARNRAYAALKNHRKRIAELDKQMERDNARMAELLELMADPAFYINEDASSDAVAEHAKLKQRLAAAEEEWFLLTEELEEEMAKQAEQL